MSTTSSDKPDFPIPALPDPEVAAEAMMRLAEVAAAAARTTAAKSMQPTALPYDPTTLVRAVIDACCVQV